MKTQKVVSKKEMMEDMKKYQVLKWTAEVREKELQCLEEVELLDNHDPVVEFESDSESEAYDIIKARVQNDLDDLAQDYLNEKYNQEALYEYRK